MLPETIMPLFRGMARTVAIAGTTTAVSNRVSRRQLDRWAQQENQQYAPTVRPSASSAPAGGAGETKSHSSKTLRSSSRRAQAPSLPPKDEDSGRPVGEDLSRLRSWCAVECRFEFECRRCEERVGELRVISDDLGQTRTSTMTSLPVPLRSRPFHAGVSGASMI